jgi:hypothetical protein
MKYDIQYNSQRDNIDFNGTFPGFKQCFTTSAWMLMSYYSLEIDGNDDVALSKYFDDVEVTVGNVPAIGELAKRKDPTIQGATSYYWEVQRLGITMWLNNLKVVGQAKLEFSITLQRLRDLLTTQPVIIGTRQLGGLPAGHIILAVGMDDVSIMCHDPYGNAKTNYTDANGQYVYYKDEMLKNHLAGSALYWKRS